MFLLVPTVYSHPVLDTPPHHPMPSIATWKPGSYTLFAAVPVVVQTDRAVVIHSPIGDENIVKTARLYQEPKCLSNPFCKATRLRGY